MTSIDCNWEFWWEEGEDGGPDSRGASGMCQISQGGKEFLTDGDFFSCQTFALLGKPITFSHIVSKTKDVSLQSRVVEVCDCSVNKASTGVCGVKDMKGIVSNETWFSEIWSSAGVGMEVAGVDFGRWPLTAFDLWVGQLDMIPDPFAGVPCSSFLVIDPSQFF
jgi:hypothetical protein